VEKADFIAQYVDLACLNAQSGGISRFTPFSVAIRDVPGHGLDRCCGAATHARQGRCGPGPERGCLTIPGPVFDYARTIGSLLMLIMDVRFTYTFPKTFLGSVIGSLFQFRNLQEFMRR